ncbi:ABC transporter ATP-binding protein [Erythrobacter sp. QSSC1-22B]|uniref:ABC transporter ATP-binding protein n=1 Tax=Erythrobacter sp. QSSC1-22B TaxID=1860125 RepID=UPI000805B619|nr:ABC transporter ATP-binding protein [Erythrobacter sp. QSSC1-22B]OBX17985.1 ABC transporter ATP-binding protein [Erythrobacter sp. QSSC1-22B]
MLEARNATKWFAGTVAVNNLELTVNAGEIVCLLGANGAGKSTAVNLFLGFLTPDEGEVLVAGRSVGDDVTAARKRLAYIPDQVNLFPLLTGGENLRYFSSLAGHRLSNDEASKLLIESGLAPLDVSKRLAGYSKGMRQKVGIAIAMAKRADALLLDEPLSGLDPLAANDFGAHLSQLRDNGSAILMVTHDVFRAREIADRIGIMKQGRLIEVVEARTTAPDTLDRLYADHMRG